MACGPNSRRSKKYIFFVLKITKKLKPSNIFKKKKSFVINFDFRRETFFQTFFNKCFNTLKHIQIFSKRLKIQNNPNFLLLGFSISNFFSREFRRESSLVEIHFPTTYGRKRYKLFSMFVADLKGV